ncbi:MAG: hypothetical protein V9E96_16475 [Chitinophagaceae bacterium]
MKLCGATFLVFNGFQMVASFSYFIIVFYMYKGSYEAAGTVPALFSIIGAVVTSCFSNSSGYLFWQINLAKKMHSLFQLLSQ